MASQSGAKLWNRLDYVLLATITAVGAILRIVRLGIPARQIFDETFYARDSCYYVTRRIAGCGLIGEPPEVHPPLGKWVIGAGLKVFGNTPFGGRIGPALAGTVTIALVYLLGRQLLGSALGASIPAAFLAVDLLHIQQSRVAALDVIASTFALAGVLAAVMDRERSAPGLTGPWKRPWRLAAGALLGAAVATKWPHILTWLLVIVLTLAWETHSRRERETRPFDHALRAEGPSITLYLLVVPMLVYVATYVGRLQADSIGGWISQFVEQQRFMYTYLQAQRPLHAYESTPWQWLVGLGPIPYLFAMHSGRHVEVLAAGNPFTWIPALAGTLAVSISAIRLRDPHHPGTVVAGAFAVLFGPWLVLSLLGRGHLFIYYLVPALPFMALGLGYLVSLAPPRWRVWVVAVLAAAGVAILAIAYPLIAAVPLSPDAWETRSHYSFDICSPVADMQLDVQDMIGAACRR